MCSKFLTAGCLERFQQASSARTGYEFNMLYVASAGRTRYREPSFIYKKVIDSDHVALILVIT